MSSESEEPSLVYLIAHERCLLPNEIPEPACYARFEKAHGILTIKYLKDMPWLAILPDYIVDPDRYWLMERGAVCVMCDVPISFDSRVVVPELPWPFPLVECDDVQNA